MSPDQLPDLPINTALPSLAAALAAHTAVLLDAPPGAGKSTLVPLFLDRSPWLEGRKILMLEPRRIAARAVANRMAQLLGEAVGRTVGIRTRLDTRVSRDTRIEVVTEGILTRLLQADATLAEVGCVIFDEFHERSLNADLGLALCVESQQTVRDDLRLLVMSATLDLAPLAALLGAPVVSSQGRSFEVATHYIPRRAELLLEQQLAQVAKKALAAHAGDILCFLPGAGEIRRTEKALAAMGLAPSVRVLPLYGELEGIAQDAALTPLPDGERKIVLATSIAETSITIEGIRTVIDGGLRRYSAFDPATGMSRLVTGKVSKAAADQRRGRAGRLSEGQCYRLWSEGTQGTLAAYTPPEMSHADLAPLALELACWGTLDAISLTWLDAPPAAPLAQARDLLRGLDALDANGRATAHGRALGRLGMHPRLGHMLLRAKTVGAARLACDLAAILSERDFLRGRGNARDADLRLRVAALRGDVRDLPAGMEVDTRAKSRVQRTSQQWQRQWAHAADTADAHAVTGLLLAWGYPDRVAQARGGGRFLMANGRGARFAEPQALASAELLVAAELDDGEREARIFLAAPLARSDLEQHFGGAIAASADVRWNERKQSVMATRERRYGALLLESAELIDANPQAVERAALSGLRTLGLDVLPWSRELRQWQARVHLMRRCEVPGPAPWPDVSDAYLIAHLEEWAPQWLVNATRREHFARMDLKHALHGFLTHAQAVIVDREAPTHVTVPSGSHIGIDYLESDVPSVSVRLQELFGLRATPRIAAGRMALVLKLLSPAGRPVQITRDLVSFWDRGYHEVKKDLKGRYPKHYWPDDPYAAQATRRARPR